MRIKRGRLGELAVGLALAVVATAVLVAPATAGAAPVTHDTFPATTPRSTGYEVAASTGGVWAYGLATHGSMEGRPLNQPIVAIANDPASGGYWLAASDGGLFSFGGAPFLGSMGGRPLNRPIVGMAATPAGGGYWEVASDGGLFSFGNAHFYGSMGGRPLNEPVVAMAPTPTGGGYWEVASDGGLFSFGNAHFYGSMGGHPLNRPIVGMAPTPTGGGYWEVASDGGLFSFGNARFYGSMGGRPLNRPIVGMAPTPTGAGYWEVASDGGIFTFGNARFLGSASGQNMWGTVAGQIVNGTVIGIASGISATPAVNTNATCGTCGLIPYLDQIRAAHTLPPFYAPSATPTQCPTCWVRRTGSAYPTPLPGTDHTWAQNDAEAIVDAEGCARIWTESIGHPSCYHTYPHGESQVEASICAGPTATVHSVVAKAVDEWYAEGPGGGHYAIIMGAVTGATGPYHDPRGTWSFPGGAVAVGVAFHPTTTPSQPTGRGCFTGGWVVIANVA